MLHARQLYTQTLAWNYVPFGGLSTQVVSLNGTWKTDSISFTVDPLYRYTVHVRNSASIGTTSINIDFIEVYGEASASYLTCIEDSGGYRFGMNSQEKVDEIAGAGNHYTAQYWEMAPRLAKRWNPDPVVKPHESPYAILANNPIWFVDPNGADTVEVFKGSGEFHSHTKAKGNDVFFMVEKDDKGNINRLQDQSITFDEGTLRAVRRPTSRQKDGDKTLTLFEIDGDDNAQQLFEFFADTVNTKVEWTHAKIGTSSSGRNVVGTQNNPKSTGVGSYLLNRNYTLREVIHNHPSGAAYPSKGDMTNAEYYHNKNGNTLLKIYTFPNNYTDYNQYGRTLSPIIITPNSNNEDEQE